MKTHITVRAGNRFTIRVNKGHVEAVKTARRRLCFGETVHPVTGEDTSVTQERESA